MDRYLPELGNAKKTNKFYSGLSLTLIDALDSLLLFNRTSDFIAAYKYLSSDKFPGFNIDIRVHLFETNIRILGGLLSAHSLTTHPKWHKIFLNQNDIESIKFIENYKNEFLILAQQLGDRLLPAFNTSNGIPYAWINLKYGILRGETRDTCTAGVGTLMLEMSLLSYLTKNNIYFIVTHRALLKLWKLRNVDNNLLGNSFNGANLKWSNINSGIGAGIDSFYEYLLKSYIYLGYQYYWDIFQISYKSVIKYIRKGPWYIETNIKTSRPSHYHFNSLQSFWPSLQILIGDIPLSFSTINSFFSIWYNYNGLPERFLLNSNQPHSTENQYPLRPELIESIFYAFQSIKNNHKQMTKVNNGSNIYIHQDYYLWLGYEILKSIQNRTKTTFGYTILTNVITGDKGDYMPSYFLAETCKYLLLLFDENAVLNSNKLKNDYIFTTEGHIFPIYNDMRLYIDGVLDSLDDDDDLHVDDYFILYEKYNQFDKNAIDYDNDPEIEFDDDDDDDDGEKNKKNKRKTNKTAKKDQKEKKIRKGSTISFEYNSRSIINSNNIDSIFIFQHPYTAICPSSPFYTYSLMHHDQNEIIYANQNKNNQIGDDDDDGMNYLWQWIHKMFGKKDEIYKDKQISTIMHRDGNVQIGDQCAMPVQFSYILYHFMCIKTYRKSTKCVIKINKKGGRRKSKQESKAKKESYGNYQMSRECEYLMMLVILQLILMIILRN